MSPSPILTTIVEPSSASPMEMENATAVPAAADRVLDPKLLLVSLLPQWRMENGEGSPPQSPTLPGTLEGAPLTVAHWRWRTAMENGEEKTERCRVTSV